MFAKRPACSPLIRRVKAAVVAATPPAAYAAQEALRVVSPFEEITLFTWAGIFLFAAAGWIVADVDKVAELWNEAHDTRYKQMVARLKLVQSVVGSVTAGVFTYFGGKLAPGFLVSTMGLRFDGGQPPEVHEFVLFMAVAGAGWLGARWFERVFGARA